MKTRYLFLAALFLFVFGVIYLRGAHSYFNNAGQSINNVFIASSQFSTPTPTPTPTPPNTNHLVISEIQIATPGATSSDFIEIYNPTGVAINLNPYRLVKRPSGNSSADTTITNFSSSNIVPSHGYFLWAHSKNPDELYASVIGADVSTTQELASDNSVAIKLASTSAVIDALSWSFNPNALQEGNRFPNATPSAGSSIERKAYGSSTPTSMSGSGTDEFKGNGYDTGDNANDFILRSIAQPQNSGSSTETP